MVNVTNKPKAAPAKPAVEAGLYVSRCGSVSLEKKPAWNPETFAFDGPEEEQIIFVFQVIRDAVSQEPAKTVEGEEIAPLGRAFFSNAAVDFYYVKKQTGETILKKAGKIVEACGVDPLQDPLNTDLCVNAYVILKVEMYKKKDGTIGSKVVDWSPYKGKTAELDAICEKADIEYQKKLGEDKEQDRKEFKEMVETDLETELAKNPLPEKEEKK